MRFARVTVARTTLAVCCAVVGVAVLLMVTAGTREVSLLFGRPPSGFPRAVGADSWQPIAPGPILVGQFETEPNDELRGADGDSLVARAPAADPSSLRLDLKAVTGRITLTGRINAVVPHPTDADTIYIAGDSGGVWKTVDGGLIWRPLTDQQCTLNTTDLAIDPVNPDIVYAGTGWNGCVLLRSLDGGDSWSAPVSAFPKPNFVPDRLRTVRRILIDPLTAGSSRGTTLYVAVGYREGLWRSVDSGATFTRILGTSSDEISDIALDPTNSLTIYAAMSSLGTSGSVSYSIQKSVNGGASWSSVRLGTGSRPALKLAIAPSNPQVLYVEVAPNLAGAVRLYKSTDGGQLWTLMPTPLEDPFKAEALAVDPSDENTLFFGGAGLHKSSDGGATWTTLAGFFGDYRGMRFDGSGRLYVGNDGGIGRTSDGGGSQLVLNGNLAITQFYGVAVSPDLSVMYGGTQDHGIVAYTGTEWRTIGGSEGGSMAIDPIDPRILYASQYSVGVEKCMNGTCVLKNTGINRSEAASVVPPLVVARSDSNVVLYYGYGHTVYKSTNQAETWVPTSGAIGFKNYAALRMAAAPNDPNVVYVANYNEVWATRNGGDSWENVANGLPLSASTSPGITSVAVDSDDDHRAYVACGDVNGGPGGTLWRTTDSGAHWQRLSQPTSVTVWVVAARTIQDLKTIFVGTDVGVLRSIDDGRSWSDYGQGLPRAKVTDLDFSSTDVLVVATYGRGVFAIATDGTGFLGPLRR